jgi:hypothetical protein
MSLYEDCVKIYEKDGQDGVLKHCHDIGWKDWGYCEPCEYNSPCEKGVCLVCGSSGVKKTITLKSAFASIVDHLQDCGHMEDDDELTGMIATMDALLNNDKGSFDGLPIYDTILVGVLLK